jgi:hypothetical protein
MDPTRYDEQLLECSACDTLAIVSGAVKTDIDEEWDHRDGVLLNVHLVVTFRPSYLRCSACDLERKDRGLHRNDARLMRERDSERRLKNSRFHPLISRGTR